MKTVFEALKSPPRALKFPADLTVGTLSFQVSQAADGASVCAVDQKGKPWRGSVSTAHGAKREALEALEGVLDLAQSRFS